MNRDQLLNWIQIGLLVINLVGVAYIAKFKIELNSEAIKERPTRIEVEWMIVRRWEELKTGLVQELRHGN